VPLLRNFLRTLSMSYALSSTLVPDEGTAAHCAAPFGTSTIVTQPAGDLVDTVASMLDLLSECGCVRILPQICTSSV
ncbi:hypothetical protein B0H17DRAFT_1040632, partial [Mycena rosella]